MQKHFIKTIQIYLYTFIYIHFIETVLFKDILLLFMDFTNIQLMNFLIRTPCPSYPKIYVIIYGFHKHIADELPYKDTLSFIVLFIRYNLFKDILLLFMDFTSIQQMNFVTRTPCPLLYCLYVIIYSYFLIPTFWKYKL